LSLLLRAQGMAPGLKVDVCVRTGLIPGGN
jgi:hypothetical protein